MCFQVDTWFARSSSTLQQAAGNSLPISQSEPLIGLKSVSPRPSGTLPFDTFWSAQGLAPGSLAPQYPHQGWDASKLINPAPWHTLKNCFSSVAGSIGSAVSHQIGNVADFFGF